MWRILIYHRLRFPSIFQHRFLSVQLDSDFTNKIKSFYDRKQYKKMIELVDKYKNENLSNLSSFTIGQLLKACTETQDLKHGLMIYHSISPNMKKDTYLITALINLYMKCGEIERAENLFYSLKEKTFHIYAAMMKGYIKNNMSDKAIQLSEDVKNPDEIIILLLFNACAAVGTNESLHLLKKVSKEIPKSFYSNPRLVTSLVDGLMKCGDVEQAESVFNYSTDKSLHLYGAMMKGYITNRTPNKAIELFSEITNPNEIIILLLINACAKLGTNESLHLLEKVSKEIPKSFYSNPRLVTSLVDGLMKGRHIKQAESIFNSSTDKSLHLYAAMMKGYIKNNMSDKAIQLSEDVKNPDEIIILLLFNACAAVGTNESLHLLKKVSKEIPKSFYSNPRLVTSLVDGLMKCGDVEQAESVFNYSTDKSLHLYGAMMKGYIKNSMGNKSIDIFKKVKNPDDVITILLFNSCAQVGDAESLKLAKETWKVIPKDFRSNETIENSYFDVLVKCADFVTAEILFSKMKKTSINYSNLMNGFLEENNPKKVLELFNQMILNQIEPNVPTYLCVVKSLSHISIESISRSIVEQIPKAFRTDNRIQTALISMWGKTGNVDQAEQVFKTITEPNAVAYGAMINSYGLNGMGVQALELFHSMPFQFHDEINYICALNACSHSGLVDEARSIFKVIQNKTESIYTTMVDCLSRASFFEEAQKLINEFELNHSPVSSMYVALLSGARNEKNVDLSKRIFDRMKKLFVPSTDELISASVLLSNVYASSGQLEESSNIRTQLNKSNHKKEVGLSWTAVNGQLFQFRAHDRSHPRSNEIYIELDKISKELTEHGHQYDSSWITRPLNENETVESALCGHSERLAIAWNFVENPKASKIQITKNLRVCGDCHRSTKLIALIRQCEIIVRDANRIHHFHTNGQCSCNDYF